MTEFNFEKFWASGPWQKHGKVRAEKRFRNTVKNRKQWNEIQTARDAYAIHLSMNKWKQPQDGSTWFNNWRDWVPELEERAEALADDPREILTSVHRHLCRICTPEHEWAHLDDLCFMSHEVICEEALATRKKSRG